MAPVTGLVETVGMIRKCDTRCLMRSMGCILKNSRSSLAERSVTDVTFCILTVMLFLSICRSTFATTLLFPKRRGLISTKWLGPSRNWRIYATSFTRSVKYSSSTIVPNLKGFSIITTFFVTNFFVMQSYGVFMRQPNILQKKCIKKRSTLSGCSSFFIV